MKKVLLTILASLSLTGCVVYPVGYTVSTTVTTTNTVPVVVAPQPLTYVVYEPDVYVGAYYIGYYRAGYGYWTGVSWDINFYVYGHAGYGRYYRGAPQWAYSPYRNGHYYRQYRREEYRHHHRVEQPRRDEHRNDNRNDRRNDNRNDNRRNDRPRRHR